MWATHVMCAAGTEAEAEGAEGAEGAKRTHRGGGGEKWAPAPQYGTAAYDDREAKFEMLQFLRSSEETLLGDQSELSAVQIAEAESELLSRLDGRIGALADDQRCSKTLERLVKGVPLPVFVTLATPLLRSFAVLAKSPYASHVLQSVMQCVWPRLDASHDDILSKQLTSLLEEAARSVAGEKGVEGAKPLASLCKDACATHTIRSLMLCLGGFTPMGARAAATAGASAKKKKKKPPPSFVREPTGAGAAADALPSAHSTPPAGFNSCLKDLGMQLCHAVQAEGVRFAADTYASPVLQLLLRLAKHQRNDRLVRSTVFHPPLRLSWLSKALAVKRAHSCLDPCRLQGSR